MSEVSASNTVVADMAASAQEDRLREDSIDPAQVGASPTDNHVDAETELLRSGAHRALFSTGLGCRPKSSVATPAPPVIVCSDRIRSVVDTANYWRQKYPRFAWSIFPESGWVVEDLWDAADIHLMTRDHCQEVLKFLSKDNAISAGLYARDWSIAHPEQFAKFMGSADMAGICDPEDPHSIVDKTFVHDELNKWPRKFLWHTAQAMRTSVVHVRAGQTPTITPEDLAPALVTGNELSVIDSFAQSDGLVMGKAPKPLAVHGMPAPFVPANTSIYETEGPIGKRISSHGSSQSGSRHRGHQPIGHIMSGMPNHAMGSPSLGGPALLNPKSRPVRQDAYNPPPFGTYGENISAGPPIGYSSRPSPGAMHSIHSPHFSPTAMAMTLAAPPDHMHAFPQGYPPMSPSAYAAQPYLAMGHPGMLPPHQMQHAANMPMPAGYGPPAANSRGSRGTSMGDMSNSSYYSNHMPTHNMDPRRPDRRNSFFGGSNSSLYNPYGGAKPAFDEGNTNRKSSRGGFMEHPGRFRKFSSADARSRNGSYALDWTDTTTASGSRNHDSRFLRVSMSDNPDITGDSMRGCNESWIGPENHNVNELFVAEIPDGVRSKEVEDMFVREVGIIPAKAVLRTSYHGNRLHAFVLFSSTADTKLALKASGANPKIRGVPVRISVPRRYFQKEDPNTSVEPKHSESKAAKERGRSTTRMSSHGEEKDVANAESQAKKPHYSPQDARSDLQKKARQRSLDVNSTTRGSPEYQNLSKRQPSEVGLQVTEHQPVEEEPVIHDAEEPLVARDTAETQEQIVASDKSYNGSVAEVSSVSPPKEQSPKDVLTVAMKEPLPGTTMQPAQEPVATTDHDRVESQTKAAYGDTDTLSVASEAASVVVKVPSPVKDEHAVQQTPTMEETEATPKIDLSPVVAPESGSEDGVDTHTTLLSAQEVVNEIDPILGHKADLPDADHSIEPAATPTVTENPAEGKIPQSPPATSCDIPLYAQSSSTGLEAVAQIAPTVDSATPIRGTSVPTKEVSAVIAGPSPPPAAAVKKQGPQQTPSLNPFAKPSKSQRRKEKKELKKKGPKKDQEDKNKVQIDTKSASGSKSSTNSTSATSAAPRAQSSVATAGSIDNGAGKEKTKAERPATGASGSSTGSKGKEKLLGKQTDNIATDISNGIGSVTQKTKVAQKTATATAEAQSSNTSAPLPRAQSSKWHDTPVPEQTAAHSPRTGAVPKVGPSPLATKVKKTVVTPPNLNLSFPNHPQDTQPGLSSSGSAVGQQTAFKKNQEFDNMSDSSGTTLNPSEGGHPSPPPSAQGIHTKLQTPTDPDNSGELADKPKKKRKKNKKKKASAVAQDRTDPGVGGSVDAPKARSYKPFTGNPLEGNFGPFQKQLSHIDAIREAARDPNTYYNKVNREIAARDEESNAGKPAERSTSPESDSIVFRSVQAFFVESPRSVEHVHDGSSD